MPEDIRKLYGILPHKPTIQLDEFHPSIPQIRLDDLKDRLRRSVEILPTYENTCEDDLGVKKDWMEGALKAWRDEYDWRGTEKDIDSFPHYTTELTTKHKMLIHFTALFSKKADAVPVIMTHGWPGSFLEFIPLMKYLTAKYTPETLPVHLVVPSMPGFGFSGYTPTGTSFNNLDTATLFDALMCDLGFEEGYVAQGGDIGSRVSRLLGQNFTGCKAVHLNAYHLHPQRPWDELKEGLDAKDLQLLARAKEFDTTGIGYNVEQATRPATLATVVTSDPAAMLAWIGEKMLSWPDIPIPLETILANVSLYWLTRTFPTSLYNYRTSYSTLADPAAQPGELKDKPVGYSLFPLDLRPFPVSVVKQALNVVWSKEHEQGGHFAALELPEVLWDDLLAFLAVAW